jgi:L-lactate dehydrogenase complex protein LldF
VVLLDNGRSDMLAGETAEILGCIRCGACLNVCPVYKGIGGHAYGDTYAGPVGAIVTPGLRGLSAWQDLPFASTLCGACRDACPLRLDIPRMLLALRSRATREAPLSMRTAMKGFGLASARPRFYRIAAGLARRLVRLRARGGWVRSAPGMARGWTEVRDLRAPARSTFQDLWRARTKAKQ